MHPLSPLIPPIQNNFSFPFLTYHSSNLCSSYKATCIDLRQELRQPFESVRISHSSNDRAHVQFNGSHIIVGVGSLVFAVGVHQAEGVLELFFGSCRRHVNFVSQNQERDVLQFLAGQESVQLFFCFGEAASVNGVHEVDDAVDGGEVILPEASRGFVATEIEGLELDVANDEFVRVGVESWDMDLHAVLFEHVQQRGFAGIVETQKQNFSIFVVEACGS